MIMELDAPDSRETAIVRIRLRRGQRKKWHKGSAT